MMMRLQIFLVSLLLSTGFLSLKAQHVTGHWYGLGKVDMADASNNYMSELVLNEKGKTVSGFFSYYFRDSLFKNKIEGTYNDASRTLSLKKQNIIYYRATSTKTGVDCPMYAELILISSRAASTLKGYFVTDVDHRYVCPAIIFNLKRSTDTMPLKPQVDAEIVEEKPVVIIEKPKDTVRFEKPKDTIVPVMDKKQEMYVKRAKSYIQEIEMETTEVKIELYDNGQVDQDSVSIFMNDKLVVPSSMLDRKAITITLPLDTTREINEISMFADNLGSVPPNTAALILYDGKTRYEILMTSDMDRTATIQLKRKKKRDMIIVEP